MSKLILFFVCVVIFLSEFWLGTYEGVIFYYVLAGLFWYLDERRKPITDRPLNLSLGAVIWPIRSIMAAWEFWKRLRDDPFGRFLVEDRRFATWDEALKFGREVATQSTKDVVIMDCSWLDRQKLIGNEYMRRMYRVDHSGNVKRLKW
jgi:hypothetical protein